MNGTELERPGELWGSLQTALLMSMKNNDIKKFKGILRGLNIEELSKWPSNDTISINQFCYDYPKNKTLLDIACSSMNKVEFVKCLLDHGADVNLINPVHGTAPIHLAIMNSDFDTVKVLVEHQHINIYERNGSGQTVFHLASQNKRKDFIELLQGRQTFDIEQAKIKVHNNKPGLSTYKYAHNETNSLQVPEKSESSKTDESLSSLIISRNYEAFKFKADEKNVKLKDDVLGVTYLQYACQFGMVEFVELLLNLNVDPNVGEGFKKPIMIATFKGYYEIVQLLQKTGIIEYEHSEESNIVLIIMLGYAKLRRTEHWLEKKAQKASSEILLDSVNLNDAVEDNIDHAKCLKFILNNVRELKMMDTCESCYSTPLLIAVILDNRDMIRSLIERGACIRAKAKERCSLILQQMKPATLEYFLDESMCTETSFEDISQTVFNYSWLMHTKQCLKHEHTNETSLLTALSETPNLKPLLKHPFFLVFMDFKWHIIAKMLFLVYLGFYIQFVFFLSVYLLQAGPSTSQDRETVSLPLADFIWYAVFFGNNIMLTTEFFQFILYLKASEYKYVTDLQNYMEIILIIIIYIILFSEIQSTQTEAILAAIAIFLSYVKLILLISNHPIFSIYYDMFKVVAFNTLKLLISYIILILAFAFTFFLLFKNMKSTDGSFKDMSKAIFKTLIMSTGEYEITNTLISEHYAINYLVFILFIFCIPIVLFNLINAIAVNDIRGIRKKAELVNTVARVRLIAYIEEIISASFSLLPLFVQLANTCIQNTRCKTLFRPITCEHISEKQHYYTNYFGAISKRREIIYTAKFGKCGTITENCMDNNLTFVVSPSTEQSIRDKILAKTSQEEEVDAHRMASVTQENASLPEVCKCLITLINVLDEKYQIAEPMLKEITKLSNQKSK